MSTIKERRHAARLIGKCGECITRWAIPDTSSCDVCAARHSKVTALTLLDFNSCCQASGFHRSDCATVRKIQRDTDRGDVKRAALLELP